MIAEHKENQDDKTLRILKNTVRESLTLLTRDIVINDFARLESIRIMKKVLKDIEESDGVCEKLNVSGQITLETPIEAAQSASNIIATGCREILDHLSSYPQFKALDQTVESGDVVKVTITVEKKQ